jgi:hypothetical protein
MNSVKIVEDFWAGAWKAPQDVDAIDRFVIDDSSLPLAASTSFRRTKCKDWVTEFLEKVADLKFEVRRHSKMRTSVASRWRVTGKNNGVLGMPADQRVIDFTGTAIWALREDGKLLRNWVERSS